VGLALLAPLACFLAGSIYGQRLSEEIGAASVSIATNGGPSVVYLATMRDDVRRIEERAMAARPGSFERDRSIIGALTVDLDRAELAELETPAYPGEPQAQQDVQRMRAPFFAAVERLLERAEEGLPATDEAREQLRVAADGLADAVGAKSEINADQIMRAANTILGRRRRVLWLFNARDALALALVIAGTALGIRAARQQVAVVEDRRRLDQERLTELDVFAGRVAHDLRDLLAVLVLRASMGEHATTLESATDALARIRHQSHRMSETIDALLTFARAAARPAPGARSDLATVVQEVVADAELLAGGARAEIVVEPLGATTVAVEPVVLGVVLSNLVRNAVKYAGAGPPGAARLAPRITLRSHRSSAGVLRVEVEDTGPGLPAGTEQRVFEPFVRLGESAPIKEGVGLGLATVKRLVEANGGQVGVVSRPGLGCRFWFTLPLVPARAAAPAPAVGRVSESAPRRSDPP